MKIRTQLHPEQFEFDLSKSFDARFMALCDAAKSCTICPRMARGSAVLSFASGSSIAQAMFIGEAPGRLGADVTGIPFHGDRAGQNFEDLIRQVGIRRADVFITNSVLCNPKGASGNNAPPTSSEILNCSRFLKAQIDIIDPRLVVTLGMVALRALSSIEPHKLSLAQHVRTQHDWYGRNLVPLYHPGQRALTHRSFANQSSDYQFVAEVMRRSGSSTTRTSGYPSTAATIVACRLITQCKPISYFALHKLFYLAEYQFFKTTGQRLTDAYIVRQKDGPYCTDLHLSKLKRAIHGLVVFKRRNLVYLDLEPKLGLTLQESDLPSVMDSTILEVAKKHGQQSNSELKTSVYLTSPMRTFLKMERAQGIGLFNAPIRFG